MYTYGTKEAESQRRERGVEGGRGKE